MEIIDLKTFQRDLKRGQVWTPDEIAFRMAELSFSAFGRYPNVVLDPACGPATFEKAMISKNLEGNFLVCCDIDMTLCRYTKELISKMRVNHIVINGDYLNSLELKNQCDIVIMNPPYVRHEAINVTTKESYHKLIYQWFHKKIDRRANLMALFMLKAVMDLKENGILCAILYDALFQTRYGKDVTSLIEEYMDEIYVDNFKTPFNNTLIDARVIVLRKRKERRERKTLSNSHTKHENGWVELNELLDTRRGTGLRGRSVFLMNDEGLFTQFGVDFIVKQSKLNGLIIHSADSKAYIFETIDEVDLELIKYLTDKLKNNNKETFDLIHKFVKGPILFNYYIRDNPRHLYNPILFPSSDNFYVSKARNNFPDTAAWLLLNSTKNLANIKLAGRNQGNGLIKLQLYEYKSALISDWRSLSPHQVSTLEQSANLLIQQNASLAEVNSVANSFIAQYF